MILTTSPTALIGLNICECQPHVPRHLYICECLHYVPTCLQMWKWCFLVSCDTVVNKRFYYFTPCWQANTPPRCHTLPGFIPGDLSYTPLSSQIILMPNDHRNIPQYSRRGLLVVSKSSYCSSLCDQVTIAGIIIPPLAHSPLGHRPSSLSICRYLSQLLPSPPRIADLSLFSSPHVFMFHYISFALWVPRRDILVKLFSVYALSSACIFSSSLGSLELVQFSPSALYQWFCYSTSVCWFYTGTSE